MRYTTILWEVAEALDLSLPEYALADTIHQLANNPSNNTRWCYASRPKLAEMVRMKERWVYTAIDMLVEKGVVELHPETRNVRTTQLWYDMVFSAKDTPAKNAGPLQILQVLQKMQPAKNAGTPLQKMQDTPANFAGLPLQNLQAINNSYNNSYNNNIGGEKFSKNDFSGFQENEIQASCNEIVSLEEKEIETTKPPVTPPPLKAEKVKPTFIPPTFEEVKTEFVAKTGTNGKISEAFAETFLAHYELKNWTYGKANKPLKNWRLAMCAAWDLKGFVLKHKHLETGSLANTTNTKQPYSQETTLDALKTANAHADYIAEQRALYPERWRFISGKNRWELKPEYNPEYLSITGLTAEQVSR